jgi:hypothetical protein
MKLHPDLPSLGMLMLKIGVDAFVTLPVASERLCCSRC